MKNEPPAVSVIIPTYNRADFVGEAIDSVLEQSFSDFEIIIVDDGSTDATSDVLKSFGDRRLKLLHQERKGVSSARNLGVSNSSSPLISFLDSDDLWMPRKLEVQMNYFSAEPDAAACQTEEIWIRNGRRVNPADKHRKCSGWIFKECLPLCIVSPSSVMMRRSIFDEFGGFDESLPACEDYDLWLRLALRYPVCTLPDALTVKRGGHEDQLSRGWGLDRYRIKALQKILLDPKLPEGHLPLVREEIKRRARIVADGAKKRGNAEMFEMYIQLAKPPVTNHR